MLVSATGSCSAAARDRPRPPVPGGGTALQPPQHPDVGLGEDQLGHRARVVGESVAHPGADLQRPTGRLGDHLATRQPPRRPSPPA